MRIIQAQITGNKHAANFRTNNQIGKLAAKGLISTNPRISMAYKDETTSSKFRAIKIAVIEVKTLKEKR